MNRRYKKLGIDTALMFLGTFSSKALCFLFVPLYTYALSTSEYGVADLISTTVDLLVPLLTVTLSEGILRMTLDEKIDNKQIFTISLSVILLGFFLLLIISPVLGVALSFEKYVPYFLCYYLSNVLLLELQCFVKGLEQVKTYAISGIISTFSMCIFNLIFLIVFKLGISGYLLAIILGNFVSIIYLIFKVRVWNYYISIGNLDANIAKHLLLYCLPLVVNSVSWWINNSSDKYILKLYCGTAAIGVYSISYKIPSLISSFSGIMTSSLQISAIDDFGSKSSEMFFSKVYGLFSSFFAIGCSFTILFSKILARFLYSGDFFVAWKYSIILVLAVNFQALGSFIGVIYTSAKKTKNILYTTLIGAIVNIILNFLLIPSYGATGAAIATLIGYFVIWIVRMMNSQKILYFEINYYRVITTIILILIQIIITYLVIKNWYIYSFVLFIIVSIINRQYFMEVILIIYQKFKREKD